MGEVITTNVHEGRDTYSSAMEEAISYNIWILSKFTPYIGSSCLEIGIGHGGFYELLPKCNYTGADIDPLLVEQARSKNPDGNYVVVDITDNDFYNKLSNKSFDSVVCINVLEHIEDHQKAIDNLLSVLNTGGYLLLFVPAFQSLFSELDTLAGHYRRYNLNSLKTLILSASLDRKVKFIRLEYFNPIGGIGWWINKFYPHKSLQSRNLENQIKLFNNWILPLSRIINPMTKKMFGQSIICIVEVL